MRMHQVRKNLASISQQFDIGIALLFCMKIFSAFGGKSTFTFYFFKIYTLKKYNVMVSYIKF